MNAGRFDRRIRIRTCNFVQGTAGEELQTWTDDGSVWCHYEPGDSGGERTTVEQLSAFVDAVFTVRWSRTTAAIDPRTEIEYQGRKYNVLTVTEYGGRQTYLRITARAKAEKD